MTTDTTTLITGANRGLGKEAAHPASQFTVIVYGASRTAVSMLTVQYTRAVPEVKFNAVEPGPTGTFQEDDSELGW
jgi:NAD(P)-dependent dehydrogenase (short-subunit alcohol dehydrogenase family)